MAALREGLQGLLSGQGAPALRVQAVREPGGASDPVHRQRVGHSSCYAEVGTHSANCAEDRRAVLG